MIIIHGENQIASRNLYLQLKKQAEIAGKQIVTLSGSDLTLSEVMFSSQSQSLLGSTNFVCLEEFFSRRPSTEKQKITEYLAKNPTLDIVSWDSKDLSTALKLFPPALIKKFDLPKYIFTFLDSFSLPQFEQSLSSAEPEQIIVLLSRRIHDLIIVKTGLGNYPTWQLTKLKSQSNKYSLADLLKMHQGLLQIDYKQKLSLSPQSLTDSLRLWLVQFVVH